MKKSFGCLSILLILILGLAACGESKTSDDIIRSDIISLQSYDSIILQNYTAPTPYTLTDYKITKRQTNIESKEDIIFCNVTVENESYSISLKEKLTYTYYDEGGWIQEKYEILEKNIKAVAPPADTLIKEAIFEDAYDDGYLEFSKFRSANFDLVKIEFKEDEQIAYAKCKFTSPVLTVDGYYKLICDTQCGWRFEPDGNEHSNKNADHPTVNVENYSADYSSAIGKTYKDKLGSGWLEIKEINENQMVYAVRMNKFSEWVTYTSEFHPLTGTMTEKLPSGDRGYTYCITDGSWVTRYGRYELVN